MWVVSSDTFYFANQESFFGLVWQKLFYSQVGQHPMITQNLHMWLWFTKTWISPNLSSFPIIKWAITSFKCWTCLSKVLILIIIMPLIHPLLQAMIPLKTWSKNHWNTADAFFKKLHIRDTCKTHWDTEKLFVCLSWLLLPQGFGGIHTSHEWMSNIQYWLANSIYWIVHSRQGVHVPFSNIIIHLSVISTNVCMLLWA